MAVAVALAERLHHSANVTDLKNEEVALRGKKPARAGEPSTQYFSIGDETRLGVPTGPLESFVRVPMLDLDWTTTTDATATTTTATTTTTTATTTTTTTTTTTFRQ